MAGPAEAHPGSAAERRSDQLFQTSDQPRFMERFNALLAGHGAYPAQITFGDDPDWKAWRETVDEVLGRAVAGGAG